MRLYRSLLVKIVSMFMVVFITVVLLNVVLGASGYSDRMLFAIINDQVQNYRFRMMDIAPSAEEVARLVDEYRATLEAAYGLDKPWVSRLPQMIWRVLTFNLGNSVSAQTFDGSTLIRDLIMERLPNTLLLITVSVGLCALIGITIGTRIATKPGSSLDRYVSYYSSFSSAIPSWWIGIILIYVFAIILRVLPSGGMLSAPPPVKGTSRLLDLILHAVLPIVTTVLVRSGGWIYQTRAIVLTTAQQEFVNVARAKGLPEGIILRRYILRVAAPPIITTLIMGLTASLGGSILTETVFGWPGMGLLFFQAIFTVDEGLIVALTFIYTVIYVIGRIILEILYLVLDPRVEY